MEYPKINVNFSSASPECELVADISAVYDIDPRFKIRKGTFLTGTDGDMRCKLEVLETNGSGLLLAMHLDTWRRKVDAHD